MGGGQEFCREYNEDKERKIDRVTTEVCDIIVWKHLSRFVSEIVREVIDEMD